MKNLKRIILLVALVIVASKVFASDFEIISESETTTIVSK